MIRVLIPVLLLGCSAPADHPTPPPSGGMEEAVAYLRRSLETFPIVALAEGSHAAQQPHDFLRRVLSDQGVLRAADVVIFEFVTALEQPVIDAYMVGEDIPFAELSGVWRNNSTSPVNPWDSPLYLELLRTLREANLSLPPEDRVRVLAGDPPLDWASIESRSDFERAYRARDPYVASVAVEQAFGAGRTVLIVYGGGHLPRVPVGTDEDGRNSLSYRILKERPGSMRIIGFVNTEHLGLADRAGEFEAGMAYETANHWVGEMDATLFFPGTRSRVVDPATGEVSWQEIPLYEGHSVRDLFDALVYIGPSSEWVSVPPSLDPERDASYLRELDRRRAIRFPNRSGS